MRSKTFVRFLLVNIAFALGLGVLALWALRAFTESGSLEVRRSNALSVARIFENGTLPEALEHYEHLHPDIQSRSHVWVVGADGAVLAGTGETPPIPWDRLPKPEKPHEVMLSYGFLGITPAVTIVRLTTPSPSFLVIGSARESRARRRNLLQIVFFGLALAFSTLISMLMTFLYLRAKSREARAVLLRLEQGDLKARFHIRQFDEMGNLMLDFNRMASEIERLVGRLQESEQARKTLFSELSHDLRTPLTSLRTSIDTLGLHWEEISGVHRKEILGVCQTEVSYFMELLESLLFIAQMDEPRYKKNNEAVNLREILDAEVHARLAQGALKWQLHLPPGVPLTVPGDSHLIRRLVRNALENAARFAQTQVEVSLSRQDEALLIRVDDDGPGMTAEGIEQFGKARTRRVVNPEDLSRVSLGLGSVIMSKILALHHGDLSIQSGRAGTLDGGRGTRLVIRLPLAATS